MRASQVGKVDCSGQALFSSTSSSSLSDRGKRNLLGTERRSKGPRGSRRRRNTSTFDATCVSSHRSILTLSPCCQREEIILSPHKHALRSCCTPPELFLGAVDTSFSLHITVVLLPSRYVKVGRGDGEKLLGLILQRHTPQQQQQQQQ